MKGVDEQEADPMCYGVQSLHCTIDKFLISTPAAFPLFYSLLVSVILHLLLYFCLLSAHLSPICLHA